MTFDRKVVAEIDQIRSSQQKTSHPNKEDAAKDVQEDKKTETEVTSLPEHEATSLTPAPALSEDDASGDTETTEEKGEVEDEEPKSAVPVGSPQDIDMDALLVPEPETPAAQDEQPATEAQVPAPHQVESDQQPEDVHVEAEPQDIPNDSDAPSQADAGPSTNIDVDKAPTPPADSPKPPPPSPKQEPPDTTEPTIDPNATEDEISSGDEPLHVQRSRRGRRGRPSISGNRPTRNRRQTRTADPAPSETGTPEREVRDEAESPAADTQQSKRQDLPGKRRASFVEDDTRDKKRSRDESEPVEEEESVLKVLHPLHEPVNEVMAKVPPKNSRNVIGMLHSQISQHRNGTIFHNPIKDSEAPDYHDIVKRPMDLKTIKTRIKDGAISNSLEFQRDVYQMFANAMMYNRPGSDVYVMTEDMMLDCESYIQTYRQTEGFVRGSQR
ncbi:hypothetical protein VNI00_001386 [Paramarasmius palmivorus]|uniref:Bromo domain-containing protein n=1 Tax=Paramarasmius palmivorus TaxID=297713 RepID=A0AAW0E6A9_9AGAR